MVAAGEISSHSGESTTKGERKVTKSEDRAGFGYALAAARKNRHFSQAELGKLVGSNVQSAVSSWEKGKTVPDRMTVFRLEEVLELVPGYLSRFLGYMPENGDGWNRAKRLRTPECIENDPDLNRYERNLLLALYREIRAHHGSGRSPKPRHTSG